MVDFVTFFKEAHPKGLVGLVDALSRAAGGQRPYKCQSWPPAMDEPEAIGEFYKRLSVEYGILFEPVRDGFGVDADILVRDLYEMLILKNPRVDKDRVKDEIATRYGENGRSIAEHQIDHFRYKINGGVRTVPQELVAPLTASMRQDPVLNYILAHYNDEQPEERKLILSNEQIPAIPAQRDLFDFLFGWGMGGVYYAPLRSVYFPGLTTRTKIDEIDIGVLRHEATHHAFACLSVQQKEGWTEFVMSAFPETVERMRKVYRGFNLAERQDRESLANEFLAHTTEWLGNPYGGIGRYGGLSAQERDLVTHKVDELGIFPQHVFESYK